MSATRLLLVEDEEHLARTLSFNLRAEGYDVAVAATLAEARALLAERDWDAVILDVMLPDGSGFSLAEELRARAQRMPVLMLTARTATADVVEGLRVGADDYLGKPFALEELFGRIAALLRRSAWRAEAADAAERVIAFGGNSVDTATGMAQTRAGQQRLTDVELKLLRFFVAHAGEELPRDAILQAVWDLPPGTARSRTLDTFVLRLRKLFEADPGEPRHFHTVYGVGYRFTGG